MCNLIINYFRKEIKQDEFTTFSHLLGYEVIGCPKLPAVGVRIYISTLIGTAKCVNQLVY